MSGMTYPGRWLVLITFGLWALCGLLVLGFLPLGEASCELAPGSSFYGEASPSWLPPGTTCTYDLGPGIPTHTDSPSPLRWVIVFMAVLGPLGSLHLRRLLRSKVAQQA